MRAAYYTPGLVQALVLMYRKHEEWVRRSGYAPMEWDDFKRERLANPLSLHAATTKATGAAA